MQFRQSQPELPPLGYFIINRPTPWRGAVAQVRHGTTIGQNPRCHLRLADPYVANWHAQIVLHVQRERSQFYIRDLGSHSGIFHNRQRLTAWGCLSQDDTVQIGSYEFVFKTLT
jgi:pSer/pThr/pTyr-binding forkhead associated (FHA) protein